jgi:hypothetical protein
MFFPKQENIKRNYVLSSLAAMLTLACAAHGQSTLRSGKAGPETAAGVPIAAATLPAGSIQLRVECGSPKAVLHSITAALKLVISSVPTTLLISGTCHENVVIRGLNNVTLQGNPTATIDGGSDPNVGTVAVIGSLNISLNNLTMTGGGQGVGCLGVSYCLLNQVTVENSLGDGGDVQAASRLEIFDSVIQDNAGAGLGVAGVGAFFGGTISGNGSDGVALRNGGFFATNPGNVTPTVSIKDNAGNGIRAPLHNTVNLNAAIITGNLVDGVTLQVGSAMNIFATSITNNGGHQVRIGDLSVARFSGFQSNTIAGANFPDVVCDPKYSATRQLAANAPGATTNCPAELPTTP